jgi:5'-3' exonuclease
MFDRKVNEICQEAGGTEPPILFYTGKRNFRDEIAEKKEYKGNRKEAKKPFHFNNLKAYAIATYDCRMQEGLEADDLLCIEQMSRIAESDTIICSRDKDLRQCSGWHFTWECGKQASIPPYYVRGLGELTLEKKGKQNKLSGNGLMFFYAQVLMGDTVDNIPGLKGYGPVKVYELLRDAGTESELFSICKATYEENYEENALEELIEQARLVYMIKELDQDGNPVMWEPPELRFGEV